MKTILAIISLLSLIANGLGQSVWTTPRPIDPAAIRSQSAPLITISKVGTIAIICREGFTNVDSAHLVVYKSTDNGTSFQRGTVLRPLPSIQDWEIDDPYAIAYDTANVLWVLWGWDDFFSNSYLELWKSTNGGASFTNVLRRHRAWLINPSKMVIDRFNNIHLLRDSTVTTLGIRIIYTRLTDGNPQDSFDALVPMTTLSEQTREADLAIVDTTIHYVTNLEQYISGRYYGRIMHSKSTDGGLSFTPLIRIDTASSFTQFQPGIVGRDHFVMIAYHRGEIPSPLVAVASQNEGASFSQPFTFGSQSAGLGGTIIADSSYVYGLYVFVSGSSIGTVFEKFVSPEDPPIETAIFDNLLSGDIEVGKSGAKYIVLEQQGTASVLLSSKDVPMFIAQYSATPPTNFSLQASPNPFNGSTRLFVTIPNAGNLRLEIFDLLGRLVYEENHDFLLPGQHILHYNPANLSSGVYLARLVSAQHSNSIKLLHMK